MSKHGAKAAAEKREQPPAVEAEPAVYALVIEKRGGGLAITEVEVPRSACKTLRVTAPDAIDQVLGKMADAVTRRFLR